MDLFETCQKGDFTGVEELRKLYEKKNPPDRPPRVPQRMEIDDDEDGEGSSESEEETEGGSEESKENGEKEENTGSRRKGQVDEDGWEVVTHKKGRGRNAK